MSINKEELGFPLYHGTSSLFLNSINELGLGGENICQKYKIIEMFTLLVGGIKKQKSNSAWWACEGYLCEKMIGGAVTAGGYNFRYGGVYLTPSFETAKRYAQSNKYGSELISYFVRVYEELYGGNPVLAEQIFPLNHLLREVVASDGEPIVLEVNGISKDSLVTEQGEPIDKQLEFMSETPEILWQQLNFESRNIISSGSIKVINLSGNNKLLKFTPGLRPSAGRSAALLRRAP